MYVRLMNSKEWRETRAMKMAANPLCEVCFAEGFIRSAQCVHHIIEVESGHTEQECRELCFRWTNLQSLCYECHKKIHEARRKDSRENVRERKHTALQRWIERQEEKHKKC